MAASMNRVSLVGRLGADPKIREFQNGGKVANLSVATSQTWKDKQTGERKEKTEWHSVAVHNTGTVGFISSYVHKGDLVIIEGELRTRKWQDQSGNDRYSTEIVVPQFGGSFGLLTSKAEREKSGSGNSGNGNGGYGGGGGPNSSSGDIDDEIPFAPEWRI